VKNLISRISIFEATQGHRNRHGSIRHLWLPINDDLEWPRKPSAISYRLRDKRLFNSKIAKFSHLRAFSAPGLRGSPWNWVSALGVKKLESCATGTRKKFDDIFSLMDTIHQRDGLTPDDSKDRAYT